MQTNLIAVGNSKGLRLPKAILAQCGIEDRVSLTVTQEGLLISPVPSVRDGWEERIKEACGAATDTDLSAFVAMRNTFDQDEWTWPDPTR